MALQVMVYDEATNGSRTNELTLEFLDERVTAREIIRSRVYQEVTEYNAKLPECFHGLVQPTDAERVLNGYRLRAPRRLNWERQFERALAAFETNGFILLVDDRQVEELDEAIDLRYDTKVSFLKLVPLIGG
ncbi:MAG: hypothetical protein HY329_05325 [Chloroflexi bacterium]|nr:hypothetical protein [Chloroflexota bacterium]